VVYNQSSLRLAQVFLHQIIEIQFGHGRSESVDVDNREQKPETPVSKAGSGFMTRNSATILNSDGRKNESPAFEAWLRAYRTRLEEACFREGRREA
jgi:hypothetical protein